MSNSPSPAKKTALLIVFSLMALLFAFIVFQPKPHPPEQKTMVQLFFIKQAGDTEKLNPVKREFPVDQDLVLPERQVKWTVNQLLLGPSAEEKTAGFYSEIPVGTTVKGVEGKDNQLYLDLSPTFASGAGATVLRRVEQLQLTLKALPNKKYPVYLKVNGKLLDVVGSDGLEIEQPIAP